ARGEAVARMKADGNEYDERMELLEEVTWPRPLEELLAPAYEPYRETHPWLSEFALSPKSVVRDMVEHAMTFSDLIGRYGLSRSEGTVLRYLADAYRALRQTVPVEIRSEELDDIIEWLGELIRQVDSSLLDEWEELVDPDSPTQEAAEKAFHGETSRSITANPRAFRVMLRNAMFHLIQLIARRDWDAMAALDFDPTADDWAD